MEMDQLRQRQNTSGTGRIIPLDRRALETLKLWAQQFGNREPEHFVFPAERYGASETMCLRPLTQPNQLPASRKHGEQAKRRSGVKCRFHDLKRTSISRMLDAGVPIAKIAKIVGWSPATRSA